MGLPIAKLICASNENKVLYDFFRQEPMTETVILSYNFSIHGYSDFYQPGASDLPYCRKRRRKECKDDGEPSTDGKYTITDEMRAQLADFYGNYTSEEETAKTIKKLI